MSWEPRPTCLCLDFKSKGDSGEVLLWAARDPGCGGGINLKDFHSIWSQTKIQQLIGQLVEVFTLWPAFPLQVTNLDLWKTTKRGGFNGRTDEQATRASEREKAGGKRCNMRGNTHTMHGVYGITSSCNVQIGNSLKNGQRFIWSNKDPIRKGSPQSRVSAFNGPLQWNHCTLHCCSCWYATLLNSDKEA